MAFYQPGQYLGRITNIGTGESEVKGTPFLELLFTVTHEAGDGQWVDVAEAYERKCRLFVSEKAERYTMDKLEIAGFNGKLEAPEFNDSVKFVCTHNENGYEDWDVAMERGEVSASDTWGTDAKKTFEAKYRQHKENAAKPAGKPKSVSKKAAATAAMKPVTDDEIPQDDLPDSAIPF